MTADRTTGEAGGFSLLELLVSMAIVAALAVFMTEMIESSAQNLVQTEEQADESSNIRKAMTTIARNLSQAALNSYWDYDDPVQPKVFQRQSELHFVSGDAEQLLGSSRTVTGHAVFFQAPFGYGGAEAGREGGGQDFDDLQDSLNSWGYFIEYGNDLDPHRPLRPEFLRAETDLHPARMRFRLMEFRLASEKMALFGKTFPGGTTLAGQTTEAGSRAWFRDQVRLTANSRPIAENIVALVLRPRAPQEQALAVDIAPNYLYDSRRHQYEAPTGSASLPAISRHQLPPVIDLTMVAVSEDSYARAEDLNPNLAENLRSKLGQLFGDTKRSAEDVAELEEFLREQRLSFRTLTSSIAIPAAKWVTSTDS